MSFATPIRSRAAAFAALIAAAATLALSVLSALSAPAAAQSVESFTVTINSSSIQPVATGFIPTSADGAYVILAEGAIRPYTDPGRYDVGWFGPVGQTRMQRAGQPIVDGMPYGALIAGFGISIPQFQFHGRIGSTRLALADVGQEFHVALNMSDPDLAALQGDVTVTVIYLPDGTTDVAHVGLNRNTPPAVGTGLIAATGDKYVVIPYGALQFFSPIDDYTQSWFAPEGMIGFNRTGQPQPEGPYGGLYASYSTPESGFYIGDGGCWSEQPADNGRELRLFLNLSPADQTMLNGCGFIVHVIRVPASTAHANEPATPKSLGSSAQPNPTRGGAAIRFSLGSGGAVDVQVFDAQGARVRSLLRETRLAGPQRVWWDGLDESGRRVASGTYFYRVESGSEQQSGRIVLVD